jgi:hypothetical protein
MRKNLIQRLKAAFIPCRENKYKPCFLDSKFLLYYVVFLLLLKIAVIPFLFCLPGTVFFADLTKINLIEFTNTARQNFGFEPLRENTALNWAAYLKAKDMIENDYFAHYSPEGITPWHWLEASGYDYGSAGENLAIGFLESEQVHLAWMNSSSHQKNILNPYYEEIGIAVLKGNFQGNETALVVQFFGSPKTVIFGEKEDQLLPEISQKEIDKELIEAEETRTENSSTIIEEKAAVEEEEIKTAVAAASKEMISAATGEEAEKTLIFLLFKFMTGSYYNLIQKIIYGSLILIIAFLLITVFCDIFIYKKFKIQYKDVILKTIGFSALWFILLFLDKIIMIELINPQNFRIY